MLIVPNVYLSLSIFDTEVYAADKSVSEKLSDFVLPIFGGETNNTTDNKGEVANFAGELTNNLVRNGIELVDVVQEVGSDLIFKPTRSFWDIAKDTYESVTNARWEYVANGAFVVNVPNLSSKVRGTSPLPNRVRFSSYDLIDDSTFGNWNISFSFNLSSSEKSSVYINDMKISNMDRYIGTTYYGERHIINSVSENEISYTQHTGSNIDIDFFSFVNKSKYADTVNLGVLRGSRNAESEQVTRAYPSGNINDNNRPDINNNIDNHINNFFPGSLSDDDIKVYNLNTTYIENTFVNGGSVTYEILNNTEDVIKESDSDFPDSGDSGGFPWSALLDLIGTIVNAISGLAQAILGIADTLLSGLLELFNDAFIPSDGFFTDNFTDIKSEVDDKVPDFNELSFVDDLKSSSSSSDLTGFDVTIPSFGGHNVEIIDKDVVAQFAPKVKTWISMLLYFLTSIVLYKRVSRVVNE